MLLVAVSGLAVTASAKENEQNEQLVQKALQNGGIAIQSNETVGITPDVMEIVNLIAKSKESFQQPILIFTKDEIRINDKNKLDDVMKNPDMTITSIK